MTAPAEVVLLVEGDIVVRHALAEYLRDCGFTVVEVANGEEARRALTTPDLTIDVVLADMSTPQSGFPLRDWIRSQNLAAEIIMTGSVEKAVDEASTICNDGPALAKPYQHHMVLDHIRQVLARRDRGRQG
jgi:DNA-binding response OmpR family regulator